VIPKTSFSAAFIEQKLLEGNDNTQAVIPYCYSHLPFEVGQTKLIIQLFQRQHYPWQTPASDFIPEGWEKFSLSFVTEAV